MSSLLKEFPLGVTTTAFVYGVVARDHVWLIGFIWSIISVFANRGMKVLSRKAMENYPETKEYLARPGTDHPGMPSGQAQIAASFVVFLAIWLWYYKREAPVVGGMWWMTLIATVGFLAMERAYRDGEQTRLQIVVGAIIGGLFGLVPYYSMLKLPWRWEQWNVPTTWSEFIWIVFVPAIIFLVGSNTHDLLIGGGIDHNHEDTSSSLATEYPESLLPNEENKDNDDQSNLNQSNLNNDEQ